MIMNAKRVSPVSWALYDKNEIIGMMHKHNGSLIMFVNGKTTRDYNKINLKNIIKHKQDIVQLSHAHETFVMGYPTKHLVGEVFGEAGELPTYHKAVASPTTKYCAGYYLVIINGIKFTLFCPKLSTLMAHEYYGPYKTAKEIPRKST